MALKQELLTVDLLLLPDFLKKVWESRETYELDNVNVAAVDRGGLVAMKRITGRPQDLSDIEHLETAP